MNQCRFISGSNSLGVFEPARAFPAQNLELSNLTPEWLNGAAPFTVYRQGGYEVRGFEPATSVFNFQDCFQPASVPSASGFRPISRPSESTTPVVCRDPHDFFSNPQDLRSLNALLQAIAGNGTVATESILRSLTSASPLLLDAQVSGNDQCVVGFLKMLQGSGDPAQANLYQRILQVRRDVLRADTNHDGVVNNSEMLDFVQVTQRTEVNRTFLWQNIAQFRAATHAVIHQLPLALSQERLSSEEVERLWRIFNHYAELAREEGASTGSTALYGFSLQDFPRTTTEPALISRIRAGNLSPQEWAGVRAILTAWDAEDQAIHAQGVAPFFPAELQLLDHFLQVAARNHESLYGLRVVAGDGGNVSCPGRDPNRCEDERRFMAQERAGAEIRGSFIASLMERTSTEVFAAGVRQMAPFELNNAGYVSATALMERARAGTLDPQEVRLLREWMMPRAIAEGLVIPGNTLEQVAGGAWRSIRGMLTWEFYFRMLVILPQHAWMYQQTIERWHFNSRLQNLCGENVAGDRDQAFSAYERGLAEYVKQHPLTPWGNRLLTFVELSIFNFLIGPHKDTGNPGWDIITDALFLPFFRAFGHAQIQWSQLPRLIQEHPEICHGEYEETLPAPETEQTPEAPENSQSVVRGILATARSSRPIHTIDVSQIPYLRSGPTHGIESYLQEIFPFVFSNPSANPVGAGLGNPVMVR